MALQEPVPGQPLTATWGRDVVREIRRLRPTPGPGMRMSYGPNGTTFAVVTKGGGGVDATSPEKELYPFRLGVGTETVTSGSTTTVKYHKVAIMPAVDIDEVGYAVANNAVDSDAKLIGLPLPKAGSGLPWVWLKDAALTDITDEAASRTTTEVYLHIDRTNHACALANTDTITATKYRDADGDEHPFHSDYNIIVGKFDLPENAQHAFDATRKPQVLGQYQIGTMAFGLNLPYKLEVKGGNLCVYIPSGCLQIEKTGGTTKSLTIDTTKNASAGNGWYRVAGSSYTGWVAVQWNWDNGTFFVGGQGQVAFTGKAFYIGVVNSETSITQYVSNPIVFAFSEGGGGGGSGDAVVVDESGSTSGQERVLSFVSQSTDSQGKHTVNMKAYDLLGSDKVLVETDEQGNKETLDDWLVDKAIDKDNFEEVLGPTITPDGEEERATGEPPPAAPSYHTHQIGQLADAEGTPLLDADEGPEIVRGWLEALGIVSGGGIMPPEDPDAVDPVVSESSINFDDASIIKHDAATASPGGAGEEGGLLALADHVHPLNIVETDAATGPTGGPAPEPPDPAQYVKPVGSALGPTGPSGEQTTDPTLASFGTDPHYARVDHIHPLPADGKGATGIGMDTSIIDPIPATDPLYKNNVLHESDLISKNILQQEWDRDSDTAGKGFKAPMCFGFVKDGVVAYAVMREVEVDRYGLIRKVGKAKFAIAQPV